MANIVTFITQQFKLVGLINYFKQFQGQAMNDILLKTEYKPTYDLLDSYLYFET